MTQRQKFTITSLKVEAYKDYLTLCNQLNEIPRLDIVSLISGCDNEKALKEVIGIFKNKLK